MPRSALVEEPDVGWGLGTVTLALYEPVPVSAALSMLAEACGVSAILPALGDATVTLAVRDADAESVIREVARAAGVEVEYAGGVLRTVGKGEALRSVGLWELDGLDPTATVDVLRLVAGGGEVRVTGSRVAVGGAPRVVAKVGEVLVRLREGRDGWVCRVTLVRVSESMLREVGARLDVSGRVGLGVDAGGGNAGGAAPVAGVYARGLAELVFAARGQDREAEVLSEGTLYVLEGGTARLVQGDTVPVPRRVVSAEGTVSTLGFDFIETGFVVDVGLQRFAEDVLLRVTPELSSVTGSVDGAPVRSRSRVEVSAVVREGEWLAIAGLRAVERAVESSGSPWSSSLIGRSRLERSSEDRLLVLVRCERVYTGQGGG